MEIKIFEINSIPNDVYEVVSIILKDAFEDRRNHNINFACGNYSAADVAKDFQRKGNRGGYLLLVYDGTLPVATASLFIREKNGMKYGGFENLGVIEQYKGKGIGKMLFQERMNLAKRNNLEFLSSSTAVPAKSSVRYHKSVGFLIYGKSFAKGYNSYNFILPITKMNFLKCDFLRILIYAAITTRNKIKTII